jgi:hypothetical protein
VKWAVAALVLAVALPAGAQVDGSASVMLDALPDPSGASGRQTVTELRARIFAERRQEAGPHVRFNLSGYVEGLVADRQQSTTTYAAVVRPVDLYAEVSYPSFDVRMGASRLVWGRLDEFQPTDVVNPIDLTKFLFEGRNEARLSVGLVRARLFLPDSSTLEAVLVPVFRPGRFDDLDEPTSPFNVTASTFDRDEPAIRWNNVQGGLRFTTTTSRVDWALTTYRGFRTFPIIGTRDSGLGPRDPGLGFELVETFPRFTMVGGDFETVRGSWGVRGEVAAFLDDELQASLVPRGVSGKSVDAGVGVDRKAGDYRIAADVLWSWRSADLSVQDAPILAADEALRGSDLLLVAAADRSFVRETRTLRMFAVYDPIEGTAFGRVIGAISLRDNVWVEGSGGVFTGSSLNVIGRLTRNDFVYARLKVFF